MSPLRLSDRAPASSTSSFVNVACLTVSRSFLHQPLAWRPFVSRHSLHSLLVSIDWTFVPAKTIRPLLQSTF
ncbi:hypothetical protein HBH56_180780 [Parastagonospora nodorum]|nr:hypothetical protein HBH56_180780 [Parastagonospora nodorum]KAH3968956.1 hypothetical protein HBH52_174230 [Parastagonospora nodorum]KAH4042897.1 hypothetical protein HBH49_241810 [Parastagonospora nodorum]KAH4064205.1 hypothetical protein HBH50_176140 [Parastagonospora nodorum]KAH4081413.1 hypothetical protein HBH46_225540 [Parastagonospora nodorum]